MNNLLIDQFFHIRIENGILFSELIQDDYFFNDDNAFACIRKVEELTEGKPMPFLIDVRKFVGNFSPSAAKIFANSPVLKRILINQVFVVDTLNGKLLINAFKRIYGQETPIQVFENIETAFAYCIESKNKFYANNN
ncbi:hypothetical protein [Xanthomarina sp. F2636L]|uniref:DUF7793 family protein n=1 Tax=Xanthomarina sp. F2636L TaxID=2996018 RepID=UPI00225E2E46|nr:hypothetical protein [Xanthomarina sp. F2636L]MCX7550972.1 hypothetical protein [Xanthomarina sp. F2636L]